MILDLFKYVFQNLEANNINYIMSGSYALNLYCTPRNTRDIDIVVDLNINNSKLFMAIFNKGYYYDESAIEKEIERQRIFNIIHHESGFKLDFIVKRKNAVSDAQFERKKRVRIDGFSAWVIAPEDLFLAKLQWIQSTGSELHLRDLAELLNIAGLDKKYISGWCKNLNLNTFNLL